MPRPSLRFNCKGIDLSHPVDRMPEGYFPVLQNVRVSAEGELGTRQGTDLLTTIGGGPVHSLRRLNNSVDSTSARLAGVGSKLYADGVEVDTGYSGNPLSLAPFRPNRSPNSYMYVGDAARMRKVRTDGVNYQMGITPPVSAPNVQIDAPNFVVIGNFESAAGWVNSGTAGAISTPFRFNTTIAQLLYDNGVYGWASIVPTAFDNNLQVGAKIIPNLAGGGETTKIREVRQAITTTVIDAIIYDAGATGPCSIVLHDISPNLHPNAVVDIAGEYVRVVDVIKGQDGLASIRCATTINHTVGQAVTGHVSFRCYIGVGYAVGQTLTAHSFSFQVTKGIGTIKQTGARKFDVITPTGVGGRPVQPDDYFHISVMVDNPANLVEGRIMLDIGDGSFTQSLYYKPFRPSDLTPNVQGTLTYVTTQQIQTTRDIYDPEGRVVGTEDVMEDVPVGQMVSGNSQWTEFKFKVADLIRVGSDQTKSLADVTAIGIQLNASATVNVLVAAWWIGGTYGLDVNTDQAPIQWAYRFRDSRTGAKSNPSPATRTGLALNREGATLLITASPDAQVDTMDVLRFGGGLNRWKVVGSYPNLTNYVPDLLPIGAVQVAEEAVFDDYVPFPISDLPRASVCNVAGTTVQWVSGDKFNLQWVPGSIVVVNGVACTLYGNPVSDTVLQIVESVGSGANVTVSLPEPTVAGYPLPALWSFGGQGMGTFMMGVGDPYNPGFLRWCKGNDADAASDNGNLEITSPSEPLMNGCVYDGRGFVFSTERLFALFYNQSGQGNQFQAQEVVSNSGLFARYAFCVTPFGIAWATKEGIVLWSGGAPKSLTDATLYKLFPHGGVVGSVVNGYYPPDYAQPNKLRLAFADNSLFFTYQDVQGNLRCLRLDFTHMGWFPYAYTPPASLFYQEEGKELNSVLVGSVAGNVYQFSSSTTDDGADMTCVVQTPALDLGDSRVLKFFTDSLLDYMGTVDYVIGFDNYTHFLPTATIKQATRNQSILPIALKDGDILSLYRNITLNLMWSGAATIYEFQPNAIIQPKSVTGLIAQYTDHGMPGYTHAREAWVGLISTAEVVLTIYTDGKEHIFNIPSTGGRFSKQFIPFTPLKGKMFMYKLSSPTPFIPFPDEILIMLKPWGSAAKFSPFRPFSQAVGS